MQPLFTLEDIGVKKGGKTLLKGINLKIMPGELRTIIGPSGAGKSTLLSLFNRLQDPSGGKILYRGQPIDQMDIIRLRQEVGMVFQLPALFPGTVADNINYGPNLRTASVAPESAAVPFLETVGLEAELLSRPAEQLSVGQQQRVSIARCLANQPQVLLLDEPTSALDPEATFRIESLCLELQNKLQLTIIWVTHNLEQALRVGGKTLLLAKGEAIEDGNTDAVFSNPKTDFARHYLNSIKMENV